MIGNCNDDTEAGVLYLESPAIVVPGDVTDLKVSFNHWVATEPRWDGANVKVSVNDGPFAVVPREDFLFNPYPEGELATGDNPMSGEQAWNGTDGGSLGGSWGQSQIDLSGYATPGDVVRLRFEMGLDGCNGRIGWYVDEVRVESCLLGCTVVPWFADGDGDGYGSGDAVMSCDPPQGTVAEGNDCNDGDSAVWAAPSEVLDIVAGPDIETFSWSVPEEPGAAAAVYDVLRSDLAGDFVAGARCAETAIAQTSFLEGLTPPVGGVWYFLVRADNDCPGAVGTLGQDSAGAERIGLNCGGNGRGDSGLPQN